MHRLKLAQDGALRNEKRKRTNDVTLRRAKPDEAGASRIREENTAILSQDDESLSCL
jgi:hypothetical protein